MYPCFRHVGNGVLVFLCIGSPATAQERSRVAFACEEGAVEIAIDRKPRLEFAALDRRPAAAVTAHQFTFAGTPFARVRVYLGATLPEEPVGLASEAVLSVYVETAASIDDARNQHSRWWQLVPAGPPAAARGENASRMLVFDAQRVAGCFGIGRPPNECAFADVSLATADKNLPLIVIAFTRVQGGANASNWSDARLLLDFRASPPRVAATADCAYNEGGGACTAIDSGMMPRSTLECEWAAGASDFLCTERSTDRGGSHRDFYLLSDRTPPRRPSEVPSLEEAARVLARNGVGQTVTVGRLGPITWIDEIRIDARRSAMLLGSLGAFHLATRTDGRIGSILAVLPHGVLDAGAPVNVGAMQHEWTGDFVPRFRSREVFRDRGLAVLQVVETNSEGSSAPPSALYWVGIGLDAPELSFDAVRLAGEGRYDHCGLFKVPVSVASVVELRRPFRALLRLQPATVQGPDEDQVVWESPAKGDEAAECVRSGNLRWKAGQFAGDMDRRPCTWPERPHRIRIEADGRLR